MIFRQTLFIIILCFFSLTALCQSVDEIAELPEMLKFIGSVSYVEWIIGICVYIAIRVVPTKISIDPIQYVVRLLNKIIPNNVKNKDNGIIK